MGRVLVRDQYSGEHWIDETSLAYLPWRDCQVIEREAGVEPEPAPLAEPPVADKRRPATDAKPSAKPAE